jgi:hypothetical protein
MAIGEFEAFGSRQDVLLGSRTWYLRNFQTFEGCKATSNVSTLWGPFIARYAVMIRCESDDRAKWLQDDVGLQVCERFRCCIFTIAPPDSLQGGPSCHVRTTQFPVLRWQPKLGQIAAATANRRSSNTSKCMREPKQSCKWRLTCTPNATSGYRGEGQSTSTLRL